MECGPGDYTGGDVASARGTTGDSQDDVQHQGLAKAIRRFSPLRVEELGECCQVYIFELQQRSREEKKRSNYERKEKTHNETENLLYNQRTSRGGLESIFTVVREYTGTEEAILFKDIKLSPFFFPIQAWRARSDTQKTRGGVLSATRNEAWMRKGGLDDDKFMRKTCARTQNWGPPKRICMDGNGEIRLYPATS